ncbi:MAG: putative DNA binding domain-containing protein [Anaerolineae bacterium]|nr:putative DNA binding domain-containing protein [Anaerolineae bacterium]
MNIPKVITIKQSPIVFLKRLALLLLIFAFMPAFLVAALRIEDSYNQLAFAGALTFNFAWTILFTSLQIIIIGTAFYSWWWSYYLVSKKEIIRQREGGMGGIPLANTYAITSIDIHQGFLGKRANYGTLIIYTSDAAAPVELKNVPEPLYRAREIEEMIDLALAPKALPAAEPVPALIAGGENQNVEFKASLQWDYRQQKRNKELHEPVMKNLAGYMNTAGGTVLIGVDDEGQILGLEPDYATMGKKNSDGFENNFNMAFNKMIGAEYRHYVDVSFYTLAEKEICVLRALPADDPVFLTYQGEEKFYIRTGNSSQPLPVSKASRYIQKRFQN